jgi:hypothetical protein
MDAAARKAIFDAQVVNTRSLDAARKQVRRAINAGLRLNNDPMVAVQTKLLGLLFCAWAEANFLKMLHMPSRFSLNDIHIIKGEWKKHGISEGWAKCIELGLRRFDQRAHDLDPTQRHDTLVTRSHLLGIVKEYVK